MNLDDLMAVWKSQDAAPLHDVNQTLLHLALRQDEAKLQKERRRERWIIYVFSAGMVAAMALFLAMMIYFHRHRPEKVVTGWDYALPIVGAAAALLAGGAMYVSHRAQAWREQRFGESLRDQLNRSIAQLDVRATIARETLVSVLLWGICPMASSSPSIGSTTSPSATTAISLVTLTFILVWSVASSVWWYRRRCNGSCCRASTGWRHC